MASKRAQNQTPHQQPTADPALAARTSSAAAVTASGQLPMDTSRRAETPHSGIVPLEPPAKRQKTLNLKVGPYSSQHTCQRFLTFVKVADAQNYCCCVSRCGHCTRHERLWLCINYMC